MVMERFRVFFPCFFNLRTMRNSRSTSSLARVSEGPRANDGRKCDLAHVSVSGSRFLTVASSIVYQDTSSNALVQPISAISNGNVISHRNQLEVATLNESSHFASNPNGQSAVGKLRLKFSNRCYCVRLLHLHKMNKTK